MGNVDLPDLKRTLWHDLRGELSAVAPWFGDAEVLLCPACCRALTYEQFSVEHILPQQALNFDPPSVRTAVPRNMRSGITLLCREPLVYKGQRVPGNGCNGWKGKHYDSNLRELLRPGVGVRRINSRGHVGLVIACYLALFRQFGYRVALVQSGLLMRHKFFNPNSLLRNLPVSCQMILAGQPNFEYALEQDAYWREPFKIIVEQDSAVVIVRNMSLRLPLSRDPRLPIAGILRYAPARFKLRPDLTTVFT